MIGWLQVPLLLTWRVACGAKIAPNEAATSDRGRHDFFSRSVVNLACSRTELVSNIARLTRPRNREPAVPEENHEKIWCGELLRCPACQGNILTLNQCSAGHNFDNDDGTLQPKPTDISAHVNFKFNSTRSFMSDEVLLQIFEDPARPETEGLPHHLDIAHEQCLQDLPQGTRVLDICCGGGQSRPWFQQRGMQYVGTDISNTRVGEELRLFAGADLLCDAHFLPFASESFDVVYSAAVLEHLAWPLRAVQEVRRVLKPGGLMLSNFSLMKPGHEHSYFHLSPLGAVELLTAGQMRHLKVWPSRNYSGFKAMAVMRSGTLNPNRLLGHLMHYLQDFEDSLEAVARKLFGNPPKSMILAKATSAEAIDWIAVK